MVSSFQSPVRIIIYNALSTSESHADRVREWVSHAVHSFEERAKAEERVERVLCEVGVWAEETVEN